VDLLVPAYIFCAVMVGRLMYLFVEKPALVAMNKVWYERQSRRVAANAR